ncbi:hypothetical protein [Massilia sp. PWRC2]|uniref:hypothetical protein n=1 Tax=Massilia sp. PWRC2 TaxID=2804626 RepID=UPI003CF520D2
MYKPFNLSIAAVALLLSVAAAPAQELNSSWRLRVLDMDHQPKAQATVQFSDEAVRFCMRGKWRRLIIDRVEGSEPAFFPLEQAVVYKLEHGVLNMASASRCNPYSLLSAVSASEDIHGSYQVVSTGRSSKRGLFSMNPLPVPRPAAPAPP